MISERGNLNLGELTEKRIHLGVHEPEKLRVHILVEIIEYVPRTGLSKTIDKNTTGNTTVCSFAIGEEMAEKTALFDTYIQIIDGSAELIIREKKFKLGLGDGIIIPAHSPHWF